MGDLFGKGLIQFSHSQPAGYYLALLHSKKPQDVPANANALVYEELIDANVMQVVAIEVPEEFLMSDDDAPSPVATPLPLADMLGSDVEGDVAAGPSSDDSSSSTTSSSSAAASAEPERELCDVYFVDGVEIRLDSFTHVERASRSHVRYKIRCHWPGHGNCEKKYAVSAAHMRRHGAKEVPAFLLAWLAPSFHGNDEA